MEGEGCWREETTDSSSERNICSNQHVVLGEERKLLSVSPLNALTVTQLHLVSYNVCFIYCINNIVYKVSWHLMFSQVFYLSSYIAGSNS